MKGEVHFVGRQREAAPGRLRIADLTATGQSSGDGGRRYRFWSPHAASWPRRADVENHESAWWPGAYVGTCKAPRSLSGEALLGQRTVAQLGTFVVGHDADDRPELGEHPLALRVGERCRRSRRRR